MASLVSTLAFVGDDLGVSPPGELQGPVGISVDETGDNLFISYGRFEFSGMDIFGVVGVYRVALDANGDVDLLSPNSGVMAEHQFADAFAGAAPQTCCAVVAGTVYVGVVMGSELPFAGNPNQWLFSCPVAAPGAGTLTAEASDPTECPVQMDRGTDGLIYALTASGYGAGYTPGLYSMTSPYAGSTLLNTFNYSAFAGQAYMQCGPREAGGRIIAGADDQISSWDNTGGDLQTQAVTLFDQLAPNMPTAVLASDGVRLWVQSQEAVPGVNENLLISNLGVVDDGSAFDNGWGIPQWINGSNSDDGSVVYVVDWDVSLTGGFFVYRLTDDIAPIPPDPPAPPLEISGFTECRNDTVLGDGHDLRVYLMTRGGGAVLAELTPSSGNFTRELDATSQLSLEGMVTGRLGEVCCEGWEDVASWATEILVFRDGRDVWCGPVTDVQWGYGSVVVEADDLTAWWGRRVLPDLTFSGVDLSQIFLAVHNAAMEEDTSPNIIIDVENVGLMGSRSVVGSQSVYAVDVLTELAKTSLDYTCYGRTVLVRGNEIDASPWLVLLDEHWSQPPTVRQRGNEQATRVVVKGSGVQSVATADSTYLDYYGLITRTFTEDTIKDQASCDKAAQTRLDFLKDALYIETPVGAKLNTNAPITLPQLIPGMRVRVDTQSTCHKVVSDFRLQKVTVSFDGSVSIDLQPIGSFDSTQI